MIVMALRIDLQTLQKQESEINCLEVEILWKILPKKLTKNLDAIDTAVPKKRQNKNGKLGRLENGFVRRSAISAECF